MQEVLISNPFIRYRINGQIRLSPVRLIDEKGEQVGVVPVDLARQRAQDAGLDLVEVAPEARPPVCRILDYGKFKYQQKKKAHKSKSHQSVLKEIRFRPKIDKHDLEHKTKQIQSFLEAGDKVQVSCFFRGREMAHRELGREVMDRVIQMLEEIAKVERPPGMEGRRMTMILSKK